MQQGPSSLPIHGSAGMRSGFKSVPFLASCLIDLGPSKNKHQQQSAICRYLSVLAGLHWSGCYVRIGGCSFKRAGAVAELLCSRRTTRGNLFSQQAGANSHKASKARYFRRTFPPARGLLLVCNDHPRLGLDYEIVARVQLPPLYLRALCLWL